MKRAPRWTAKRLEAALSAIGAMLACEEDEGDAVGVSFDDLEAAQARLTFELDRLNRKRH